MNKKILTIEAIILSVIMISSVSAVNVNRAEIVKKTFEGTDGDCSICENAKKLKELGFDLERINAGGGKVLCVIIGILICWLICGNNQECGLQCSLSVQQICTGQTYP